MSNNILCILDTKRSQKNTKITAFPDPPVNFYHVNEHKQKKSKRPAVWSDRKVTHRPISKLKNYKMQKASSLKRTTSHCWIFLFFIPVISRILKSDCTKINFSKIGCYVIIFEGFERILIIGSVYKFAQELIL